MAVIFVLGFFLDSLEIIFLVVPIAMPPLLFLGVDPIWVAVLTAVNLQTSFLVPPFGFALFFLRGVAPRTVKTTDIYRGALPFIAIQLLALALLWWAPPIATGLPRWMNALPALSLSPVQNDPVAGEPYSEDQPIIVPPGD
jgi:TRAP-type mannitol/chloroaromatic compound transport system permease large subunit